MIILTHQQTNKQTEMNTWPQCRTYSFWQKEIIVRWQVLQISPIGAPSVVVLTYQRCGSSFFGQLFNSNPRAFYMFEPLDALYSAMYGTGQGYNVPSDITTYWNGTER